MDNVIKANIKSQDKTAFTRSVWQYDYGQILQITGVELPPAVEVQFALAEKSGETITRVANTVDGVTEVQIPNELLKRDGCMGDYFIYAFIFVSNKDSGNTKYEIQITVKKRPKPEEPTDEPEQEENLFHATVVAVNAAADRAESAVKDAEEIRDNLNLDLSEKITRPRSAEVGQVLAVKAVDEDGKPTEIEAQDIKVPTKTSQLENDSGFLTEHQDISGKLEKEKLPEAIDDALAQAKESGEFDGKDGAPGEQGPKGDPGETTYIENPYDDTKLKTEVDKKLTTPTGNAKVGQILRVQSVNDDGSVVLETVEMPTESVSDIQINGNSIVGNSGIAEIPIGSQGKPGVLGIPGGTYGLDKDDTNNIRIIGLTNGEVDKRFYAKPVMGNTLDYAVKAAMCDGKGNAWTVDEQAAARERMDAEQGSYRFIADMVLEEDTSSIVIDKDLSGEPLSLKTARVIVQHPVPRESDKDNGYVLINNTGVYYGAVDWKASDQVTVAMVDVYVYGENAPAFVTFSSAVPIQIAQNKNSVVSYGNEVQYFEKINVITVLANYYIDKGARIIILGKE